MYFIKAEETVTTHCNVIIIVHLMRLEYVRLLGKKLSALSITISFQYSPLHCWKALRVTYVALNSKRTWNLRQGLAGLFPMTFFSPNRLYIPVLPGILQSWKTAIIYQYCIYIFLFLVISYFFQEVPWLWYHYLYQPMSNSNMPPTWTWLIPQKNLIVWKNDV